MKSFFISSTFKDMQAERDMLHQSVFPILRRRLKQYGEDIQELDLRWGVDTTLLSEEESGLRVIESCIDSIDRCRPYMIVFMGERYGWIPDSNLLQIVNDDRLSQWYKDSMSITQMEILYGAMSEADVSRCIFCFRDEYFSSAIPEEHRHTYESESTTHRDKLKKLKEKITNTAGAEIIEYSPVWDDKTGTAGGLEQLKEKLTEAVWNMIKKDVAGKRILCQEERILAQAESTAERYNSAFITRDRGEFASLLTGRHGIWCYGEAGCGKSALLSHIYAGAKAAGFSPFIYYTGNENCDNIDIFLNTLLCWLKKENTHPLLTDQERSLDRDGKLDLIISYLAGPAGGDKVILVDIAGEQADFVDPLIKIIEKFPRIGVTSYEKLYFDRNFTLYNKGFVSIKLGSLEPAEVIAIAQLHAKRRGKHLDVRTQDAIRKKQSSLNPYYLSLVLQQLFMMNGEDFKTAESLAPGMEGLSLYFQQLIENMPDNLEEMSIHTLNWALAKAENTTKGLELGADIMGGMETVIEIARSKNGLTMTELEEIASKRNKRFLPMEIHKLLCMLYDSFHETDSGRWKCANNILRESILSYFDLKEDAAEDQYQTVRLKLKEADEFREEYLADAADKAPYNLHDSELDRAHLCLFRSIGLYEELLTDFRSYLRPEEYLHVCRALFYTTGQRIDLRLANDVVNWSVDRWVPIYLGTSREELDRQMEADLARQAELAEDVLQREEAFRRSVLYYEKIAARLSEEPVPQKDIGEEKRKFYSCACETQKEVLDLIRSGDIAKGLGYARSLILHLYGSLEWFEELFKPEDCLAFFREVVSCRRTAPVFDRSYQTAWMQLTDFGVYNCQRLLIREKDVKWLWEGLAIAKEQRSHMENLLTRSDTVGDIGWYNTHIWKTYVLEQDLYMEIAENDIAPEEEWLPAMLETVERQLRIPSRHVYKRDQKKVLDRLYQLKRRGLKDQVGIQKTIDRITEEMGDSVDISAFTMQQKAMEQKPAAAESSEGSTFDILDQLFGDLE